MNLHELYERRQLARDALNAAAQALQRGRSFAADATASADYLALMHEGDQAAAAQRLADAIAQGGELPTATTDDTLLKGARAEASLASKALAALEAAHAQRQADLQAAERAVSEAVDQTLREEDIDAAQQVSHHLNEAIRLGTALLHLTVAGEMNGDRSPPEVVEVLARLDLPLIDRRNVAINLMVYGDSIAAAKRGARRAALINGEEYSSEPTPVGA